MATAQTSSSSSDAEASPRKRPKPGERRIQILQTLAAMLEQPGAERITTAALAARIEVSEAALYRLLADHLPGTTVVSIGHRSTLAAFHPRRVVMEKNADGAYTPVDQAKTAAAE